MVLILPVSGSVPFFMGLSYIIAPFRLEGGNITFSEWISIITLCLAPILAHIVGGAPEPTMLWHDEPKWHDRICHYNPTSILWRYVAITDRRIRARTWDEKALAATNALFWTERGWNGSEEMVSLASPYWVRLPQHARLRLLSWETVKTIIISLQGVQAVVMALSNFYGLNDLAIGFGMDTIFVSVSSLGLLRLSAAIWLIGQNEFAVLPNASMKIYLLRGSQIRMSSHHSVDNSSAINFRLVSCWTSRLFLTLYILLLQGSLAVLILYSLPGHHTATTLVFFGLNGTVLTMTIALFTCYFIRGFTTTTIIPCISSLWYKVYTFIIIGFTVLFIVVAGLQTRRTPCGKYTSWPSAYGDQLLCETANSLLIPVGTEPDTYIFGLASWAANNTAGIIPGRDEIWVDNFTGSCMGHWSNSSQLHVSIIEV